MHLPISREDTVLLRAARTALIDMLGRCCEQHTAEHTALLKLLDERLETQVVIPTNSMDNEQTR